MLEPLGEPVSTSTFYDSEHALNFITSISYTGILLFVCNGPIKAFSKQHNNFKSSTFGSELVALRISRVIIVEFRIKLESIGVPLIGKTDVYCDNQGVVKNMNVP